MSEIMPAEFVRIIQDIASLKVSAAQAEESREEMIAALRELKVTLAGVSGNINHISVVADGLSQLRASVHDRMTDIQRQWGTFEEKLRGLGVRLEGLEKWCAQNTIEQTVNRAWRAWLVGGIAAVGSIVLSEAAHLLFTGRP